MRVEPLEESADLLAEVVVAGGGDALFLDRVGELLKRAEIEALAVQPLIHRTKRAVLVHQGEQVVEVVHVGGVRVGEHQAVRVEDRAGFLRAAAERPVGLDRIKRVGTVCLKHRPLVQVIQADREVALVEVLADEDGEIAFLVVAGFGADLAVRAERHAGIVVLQYDVDHAGDRVGAVGRRGTVLQHLDPLDLVQRDVVEVDAAGVALNETLAVHQHQRTFHAQVSQVDAGGAAAAVVRGVVETGRADLGQLGQHVFQRLRLRVRDLCRGDFDYRRLAGGVAGLQTRARHHDVLGSAAACGSDVSAGGRYRRVGQRRGRLRVHHGTRGARGRLGERAARHRCLHQAQNGDRTCKPVSKCQREFPLKAR